MHDIDFTGARALKDVVDELGRQHVAFAMARPGRHLIENVARGGLLKRIGTDHLYTPASTKP